MGEIVQIHLGNCGNQIASSFYEYIADEHGLDSQGNYIGESSLQREKIHTFFQPEILNSKYSPRALLVDLDSNFLDSIRNSNQNKLFRAENLINMKNGANNIWSKGYYTDSSIIMKKILEQLRKETEICDSFRGFQVVSSIGGGTGGGLMCKLLDSLKEEYKTVINTVTILPSVQNSENALAAYNSVLSMPSLIEKADQCIMISNETLFRLCEKVLFLENASFPDINHLIAGALGIFTGGMRFMGPNSSDLHNVVMSMTPFEKMHFLSISLAPLAAKLTPQFKTLSEFELFQQMNQESNFLSNVDLQAEKTLAVACFFRGHMSNKEAEGLCSRYWEKNGKYLGKFTGKSCFLGHCSIPPKGVKLAGSCLVNSASFRKDLQEMKGKFEKMLKKKSFLHWFTMEGMEEKEFGESLQKVDEILQEYEKI